MPKKILLADDSITIQKVVELTFSEGDYQVFSVGNGSLALRRIQEVRPDIALLDVIMPEVSGYEVCEKVKKDPATSRIPVLLLTGTFEPFDRKRAEAAGAEGHLTKPFESQALIAKVEELIADSRRAAPEDSSFTASAAAPALSGPSPASEPHGEAAFPMAARSGEASIPEGIVPDRYDDTGEGRAPWTAIGEEELGTLRTVADTGPVAPETAAGGYSASEVDPVAETWDELASGLSSASPPPRSAPSAPQFPSLESPPREASFPSSVGPELSAAMPPPPPPEFAPRSDEPRVESAPAGATRSELSGEELSRIAARVVEQLSDQVVREIAWEVIPEIAESLIRRRIQELEDKIAREG